MYHLIFLAIFMTPIEENNWSTGLPAQMVGVTGVTQCSSPRSMPSNDILARNTLTLVNQFVFSFGGKDATSSTSDSTTHVYKYDLTTDQWTTQTSMNQPRSHAASVLLSDEEIFISGKKNCMCQCCNSTSLSKCQRGHNLQTNPLQ